jgi:hypothetical protein
MDPRLPGDDIVSLFEPTSGAIPVQPIARQTFCNTLVRGPPGVTFVESDVPNS